MRACLDANAATGAEFTLEVENNGLAVPDFIDLITC
jgi:hypothetical protein